MATKSSIIYSTNPKMDSSGITARPPGSAPVVTGGTLYKAGLEWQKDFCKDSTITRPDVLRKAAKMVERGVFADTAMLVLSRK